MSNPRPNPYVGPRSFETDETLYGRARELRMLSAQLISERVVLLHSPSGAGKTSLIQAGLAPLLRQENFHVLPLARVNLDSDWKATPGFNRYTFSVIAALEEGLPEEQRRPLASLAGLTLDAYLTKRPRPADAPRSDLLLFDQFEEILTTAPTDQAGKQAFFSQLGAALRNPARWALFAMREDYLGALAPYVRPLPNRFEATFRLDLLGVDAALQAIQSPAQAAGVTFSDEAARKLADDLRRTQVQQVDGNLAPEPGPYIEPVQLQVVCYRLWQSLDADAVSIDRVDTDAVGDVDQSLAEYYASSVENAARETGLDERSIREWFNDKLITKEGLRGQVLLGPEKSDGLDNRAIRLLENAHLLRAEKRVGATWFELSHDRLLGPVKKDNTAWFEQHLSLFQKRAALWASQDRSEGLLLRGKEFVQADKEAKTLSLTTDESAFVVACRELRKREQRDRRLVQFVIAGFILSLVLLGIAIFFGIEAKKQSQIALARQLAAQAQSLISVRSSNQMLSALLDIQSIKLFPNADTTIFLNNNNLAARPISRMPHDHEVDVVAFSPNGQYVVSISNGGYSDNGTAHVWEAATGREVARMTHDGYVYAVAFSPDSKYIASGGCDKRDKIGDKQSYSYICIQGSARVWEAASGKEVVRMTHDGYVRSVAFSPDGKYVASGSDDNTARVWEAASGKEVARMTYDSYVDSVAFSSDSKYVVSAGCDKKDSTGSCTQGSARVWEAITGKEVARMTHDSRVLSVAFSQDGKYVVSSSWDGTARIWEATSGKEVTHMSGVSSVDFVFQGKYVPSVAFSLDSKYIVSGSWDETVRVWETTSGKEVTRMTHDGTKVNAVAFSQDGKYVVSGGCDKGDGRANDCTQGSARVWEVASGEEVARMTYDGDVYAVTFSPDGKYVVSGGLDKGGTQGFASVWEAASRKGIAPMTHDSSVDSVAFSPDGKYIVSLSYGYYTARVWEAASGKEVARMTLLGMSAVAFSPDSKYVVSGGCDVGGNPCQTSSSARVWEAASGKEVARMTYDDDYYDRGVWSVAFSPDGKYVVSGGNNTARVWETASGKEVARMTHDNNVTSVAFSPDGKYVFSVGGSIARVWEAVSGKEVARMNIIDNDWVLSVAFSPDGKYVVSGGDKTAHVWEAASGREVAHMTNDSGFNNGYYGGMSVAFSPDGKYVVSGGWDHTARVWEAASGREVARMTHDDRVSSVAFSPDGKYVVSSGDNTARVWEAASGKEVTRITYEYTYKVSSAAFSPDGKYIVLGSSDKTVRVWEWRSDDVIAHACAVMPRNLTRAEWQHFIGDALPYQAVCENLPIEP